MNLLVVGSGGREHALCWHLAHSPKVERIYCAPGNGGIAEVARLIDIEVMDFDALIGFCKAEAIDFVVVGPEAPLAAGRPEDIANVIAFLASEQSGFMTGQYLMADGGRIDYITHT